MGVFYGKFIVKRETGVPFVHTDGTCFFVVFL